MKLKRKSKLIVGLSVLFLMFFIGAGETFAARGLLFTYTYNHDNLPFIGITPGYTANTGEARYHGITRGGNIDYWNCSTPATCGAGESLDDVYPGRSLGSEAKFMVSGEMRIPQSGYYRFWFYQTTWPANLTFSLYDQSGRVAYRLAQQDKNCETLLRCNESYLPDFSKCCIPYSSPTTAAWYPRMAPWEFPAWIEAGWYRLELNYDSRPQDIDNRLRLFWNWDASNNVFLPDSNLISNYRNVPADFFSTEGYGVDEFKIPKDKDEQIDFLTSGVGIYDEVKSGSGTPEIEVQLPAPITSAEIRRGDGIWFFWRGGSSSNNFRVRNVNSGDEVTLTGTNGRTGHGLRLSGQWAAVGSSAEGMYATDAGNRLRFAFPNLTGLYETGGIGMVVVYNDARKRFGQLTVRPLSESVYNSVSHPIVYNITDRKKDLLKPFFMIGGGSTKYSSPFEPRPTFISFSSRPGTIPGDGLFVADPFNAGNKISPRNPGSVTLGNPNSWYPMFARERLEFDVLAPAGNYTPNLRHNATSNTDGNIADFSASSDATWMAFQLASSNFPENWASVNPGSNESSAFNVTGMLSYSDAPMPRLIVCPEDLTKSDVAFDLTSGSSEQLEAFYWPDIDVLPTCTEAKTAGTEAYDTRQVVTADPGTVWNSSNTTAVKAFTVPGLAEANIIGVSSVSAEYANLTDSVTITVTTLRPKFIICPEGTMASPHAINAGIDMQMEAWFWNDLFTSPTCAEANDPANPINASKQDVSEQVAALSWSSSNTATATVTPGVAGPPVVKGGLVHGVAEGIATISATFSGLTDSEVFAVTSAATAGPFPPCKICNQSTSFQCIDNAAATICDPSLDCSFPCPRKMPWRESSL